MSLINIMHDMCIPHILSFIMLYIHFATCHRRIFKPTNYVYLPFLKIESVLNLIKRPILWRLLQDILSMFINHFEPLDERKYNRW